MKDPKKFTSVDWERHDQEVEDLERRIDSVPTRLKRAYERMDRTTQRFITDMWTLAERYEITIRMVEHGEDICLLNKELSAKYIGAYVVKDKSGNEIEANSLGLERGLTLRRAWEYYCRQKDSFARDRDNAYMDFTEAWSRLEDSTLCEWIDGWDRAATAVVFFDHPEHETLIRINIDLKTGAVFETESTDIGKEVGHAQKIDMADAADDYAADVYYVRNTSTKISGARALAYTWNWLTSQYAKQNPGTSEVENRLLLAEQNVEIINFSGPEGKSSVEIVFKPEPLDEGLTPDQKALLVLGAYSQSTKDSKDMKE